MYRLFLAALYLVLTLAATTVQSTGSFTIEDIRIEGLQRVSPGTVFNYLPVKVGDEFDQRQSSESIKALSKTGFFKDVRLEQDGDTLVVIVEERPSISSVQIEGNKDIGSDDLKKALKGIGLTEGKVFEDGMLIMGSPAKAVRPLSEADITRMQMGTALYVSKSAQYRTDMVRIDAPKE